MPDPLYINASAGAPAYDADEMRRGNSSAMQYGGRAMGARAGVRPGGTQLQVQLSGSTITVKAGIGIADPGLTALQGCYICALSADTTTSPLTAAHATLPRKDIVVLRVYDNDMDSSGQRVFQPEYIAGTAAASPAEPSVPAGAFRLATIDVPASGGGSAVVTNNSPFTVASGGVLPVRSLAERTTVSAYAYDGFAVWRQDVDRIEVWTGAAWAQVGAVSAPWGELATPVQGTANVNLTTSEILVDTITYAHTQGRKELFTFNSRASGNTTGVAIVRFRISTAGGSVSTSSTQFYEAIPTISANNGHISVAKRAIPSVVSLATGTYQVAVCALTGAGAATGTLYGGAGGIERDWRVEDIGG